MEEGTFPIWKGLFDWSMKFQDGTRPANYQPSEFTPERRAWLQEALSSYMQDFASRMKEIKKSLEAAQEEAAAAEEGGEAAEAKLQEREQLLEELMDIVSSIDYARDLHKIGGLPPLLDLLRCRYPSLRWRAAEVVATCCSNNAPVQQWFSEGGVLQPLMQLMEDSDATCRTKALLALSALIRHYSPGLAAFRGAGGLEKLVHMCWDTDARVQRKALTLLQYMLVRSRTSAGPEACALGVVPPLCRLLGAVPPPSSSGAGDAAAAASSSSAAAAVGEQEPGPGAGEGEQQGDSELRQAGLSVLLELARSPSTWSSVQEASTLPSALAALLERHWALPVEDQDAQREEQELAVALQQLLDQGGPPGPSDGQQQQEEEESDHVALDLSEPNIRDAAKATPSQAAAAQQQQQQQQQSSLSLAPGGGAMMMAPKVDLF